MAAAKHKLEEVKVTNGIELEALECSQCHYRPDVASPVNYLGCPNCRRRLGIPVNYVVSYSRKPSAEEFITAHERSREQGIWRWAEMLPVKGSALPSLGEGDTPLLRLGSLGTALGMNSLYLKNESANPTWSHKDRLCCAAVAAAMALDVKTVAGASTGNHGASLAAYAARAGLSCVISTVSTVPRTMRILMDVYGARVEVVSRSEDRFQVIADGVRDEGWLPCTNGVMPPVGSIAYGVDAYKTIAYELWEQTGGRPIDAVVVPIGYGDCLSGIVRGFGDLAAAGVINYRPKIIAAEILGKLSKSLESGQPTIGPYQVAPSAAFSIGGAYTTHQALNAVRISNGTAINVREEDILDMQVELARTQGIYAEAAACVPLGAVRLARSTGLLSGDSTTVVLSTSTGLKDTAATDHWLTSRGLSRVGVREGS